CLGRRPPRRPLPQTRPHPLRHGRPRPRLLDHPLCPLPQPAHGPGRLLLHRLRHHHALRLRPHRRVRQTSPHLPHARFQRAHPRLRRHGGRLFRRPPLRNRRTHPHVPYGRRHHRRRAPLRRLFRPPRRERHALPHRPPPPSRRRAPPTRRPPPRP